MLTISRIFRGYRLLAKNSVQVLARNCHNDRIKIAWEKPEPGWTKLNFDGSCKPGKTSIGGVIRNHNAEFLLGYAESIGKTSSAVAEFAALQRGLELVLENGWTDLWLEGDYKTLVDILAERKPARCMEVQKRVDLINLIILEFRNCLVTHIYREGNRTADKFAKMGHKLKRPEVWLVPPREVLRIMNEDAEGKIFYRMK